MSRDQEVPAGQHAAPCRGSADRVGDRLRRHVRAVAAAQRALRRVLGLQLLDQLLDGVRVPLTGVLGDDVPLGVDDDERRPGPYGVLLPGRQLGVVEDRVVHPVPLDGVDHGLVLGLVHELRRVHADDHHGVAVLLLQLPQLVQDMQAVHAAERPEIEDDDASSQVGEGVAACRRCSASRPCRSARGRGHVHVHVMPPVNTDPACAHSAGARGNLCRMRFLVRERLFAIGDDYWIEDERRAARSSWSTARRMRLRDTFELKDADGRVLVELRQKLISLRDTMLIERDGEELATIKRKRLSLLRNHYRVTLVDGTELDVSGKILDREFAIEYDGELLAQISRRWLTVRDTYGVDVVREDADSRC